MVKKHNVNSNPTDLKEIGLMHCIDSIGGKWKPMLLFYIAKGVNRFNKLFTAIDGINRQMLSKQLKELEKSGLLERTLFPEIPPRVEYTLTPLGKSLLPIVQSMSKWGQKQQQGTTISQRPDTQQLPLFD